MVFLVAKDPLSSRPIRICLERAGYHVREYFSCEILRDIEILGPALVLIEIGSGDESGFDLCRSIRSSAVGQQTRVILLVSRDAMAASSKALEFAADACLVRPIIPGEFLAHVDSILGHAVSPLPNESAELQFGDLHLDLFALRVSVSGKPVPTTVLEFRLIEYLARSQGRVFTRDQLLDAIWGEECFVTPRTVDACVSRIRTKIAATQGRSSMLKTIRGIGYCLEHRLGVAPNSSSETTEQARATVLSSREASEPLAFEPRA
jgi:DNA-binding response OmpR family regulator